MDAVTIRETFLRFFEERDHERFPSASLIPNDPTLLLTSAGMVPFKPYFLGDADPGRPRRCSYQKCARTTDIDNVGHTTRHLTFFEMLGNFSFGDYFKRAAIVWAWELATQEFGLQPERIWVTAFEEDDEAPEIWTTDTDVPSERIQAMGRADNFWWMHVAGPGGPNTELYYDRGPDHGREGGPAVDDERYLEFYNLVFMQYLMADDGAILGDLPKQNVDTGMGLERMAVLLQDVPTVYETDVLGPILERAQELTGRAYGEDPDTDVSLRVIAEHARTATFLIADGVLPSKEGRGYVLRRLLRRAVRHARLVARDGGDTGRDGDDTGRDVPGDGYVGGPVDMGIMPAMVDAVIATMAGGYPDLQAQRQLVARVVGAEEADFQRTLRQGLEILEDAVAEARDAGEGSLPGGTAFKLHDTYGFPIDLTVEIIEEAGLTLDRSEFGRLMEAQRERARRALRRDGAAIPAEVYREAAATAGGVEFVGYDRTAADSRLAAMATPDGVIGEAGEGDEVDVVLAVTPFYPEGGGQVGDRGVLQTATGRLEVLDTRSPIEGVVAHRTRVAAGEVAVGQDVHAQVDERRRHATERSHSATHILHATVREILGDHAQQAGSLVEAGRLRFDFPHFEQVPRDELERIESWVNDRLLADHPVRTDVMPIDEARAAGAIALFGEKYGQQVRVVTIGDYSKELCGGTHVRSAARVGGLVIVREESIGANQRRIEALTGADAYVHAARERLIAEEAARLLDVPADQLIARIEALTERLRDAERQLARARSASLAQEAREIAAAAQRQGGLAVVSRQVADVDADELRQLALEIRGHLATRGVVVVGTETPEGTAQLVGVVTPDLADEGVEARPILHPAAQVVGGGAGGRGDLAQAGGREGRKLAEALRVAADEARKVAS
ncbi:MAG TPA: alanine--tRNA ligase [Nitriliruptorales bacterium]|nr:alanine--tRNA ligase [Nitriliruptorales bacterium]